MNVLRTRAASHKGIKKIPMAFRNRREEVAPLDNLFKGAAFQVTVGSLTSPKGTSDPLLNTCATARHKEINISFSASSPLSTYLACATPITGQDALFSSYQTVNHGTMTRKGFTANTRDRAESGPEER